MKTWCIYTLSNGMLHEVNLTSNKTRGRYHLKNIPPDTILIDIKKGRKGLSVTKTQEESYRYETQAILMFHDMWDYNENAHVNLSESLIQEISLHVENSINKIIGRYNSFASEDMITASLGDRLHDEFNESGIDVDIKFQSYSSVKKEPINGADLSFIFDIKDNTGQRVIKTILIQSKIVNDPFDAQTNAPRLKKQIAKMKEITRQSYVFQYSEKGFTTYNTSAHSDIKEISTLFSEVLRCESGDKNKSVLASSLDSKYVMQIIVDERDA